MGEKRGPGPIPSGTPWKAMPAGSAESQPGECLSQKPAISQLQKTPGFVCAATEETPHKGTALQRTTNAALSNRAGRWYRTVYTGGAGGQTSERALGPAAKESTGAALRLQAGRSDPQQGSSPQQLQTLHVGRTCGEALRRGGGEGCPQAILGPEGLRKLWNLPGLEHSELAQGFGDASPGLCAVPTCVRCARMCAPPLHVCTVPACVRCARRCALSLHVCAVPTCVRCAHLFALSLPVCAVPTCSCSPHMCVLCLAQQLGNAAGR